MKIGLKILTTALAVLVLAGCGDKKKEMIPNDGWKLVSWNGSQEMAGKVYLQLNDDLSFVLYQSFTTTGFRQMPGTYTITPDAAGTQTLAGVYSDGVVWKDSYVVEKRTANELVLRSVNEQIVSEYAAVVVPAEAKQASASAMSSGEDETRFL